MSAARMLSTRLPPELAAEVDRIAKSEDRSWSGMCLRLIQLGVIAWNSNPVTVPTAKK